MKKPELSAAQRAKLTERLQRSASSDAGLQLPQTTAAWDLTTESERIPALVQALTKERVIIPVFPHAVEGEECSDQELAVISLDPNRTAQAVFTGISALESWNSTARPAPVTARSAALVALEGPGRLVVNPGSERSLVLGRPATGALASGDIWLAPWQDSELQAELSLALSEIDSILQVILRPGRSGVEQIILTFSSADPRNIVKNAVVKAQHILSQNKRLLAACDAIEIVPVLDDAASWFG